MHVDLKFQGAHLDGCEPMLVRKGWESEVMIYEVMSMSLDIVIDKVISSGWNQTCEVYIVGSATKTIQEQHGPT